jgi:hypothetical protein
MPAMLILDRHRALDFLIATSMRADVPEPFVRVAEPASILELEPEIATEPLPETVPAPAAAPAPVLASLLARPERAISNRDGRPGLFATWWRGVRSPVAWSG